jgi:hypothetical protein
MQAELGDLIILAVQTATGSIVTELKDLRLRVARLEQQVAAGEQHLATADGRLLAAETRMLDLGEQITALEARPPQPGPPGPPGEAGMRYLGVFQRGAHYGLGDVVTCGGSMWHCNKDTHDAPQEVAHDWTLAVKHGRDLREPGRNGGPH